MSDFLSMLVMALVFFATGGISLLLGRLHPWSLWLLFVSEETNYKMHRFFCRVGAAMNFAFGLLILGFGVADLIR